MTICVYINTSPKQIHKDLEKKAGMKIKWNGGNFLRNYIKVCKVWAGRIEKISMGSFSSTKRLSIRTLQYSAKSRLTSQLSAICAILSKRRRILCFPPSDQSYMYIPSTINIFIKGAHQSHMGRQKMGWFLAD